MKSAGGVGRTVLHGGGGPRLIEDWRMNLRESVGFELLLWSGEVGATKERNIVAFCWDSGLGRLDADRYMVHLKQLQIGGKWSLVDAANKHPNLFRQNLRGFDFRGTSDVVIIDKVAANLPEIRLKIIFELKKDKVSRIDQNTQFQAIVSLVLTNIFSRAMRPVAMLTDLVDIWTLFWMDGLTIFYHEFETRALAVGRLEDILRDEDGVDAMDDSPDILSSRPSREMSLGGMSRSMSKRQKSSLPEMEQLEELVGFVPGDELQKDHVGIVLKHLLKMPLAYSMCSDVQASSAG